MQANINKMKLHTGVTVYLAPLDSLPPGGQAVPGYLTPHPGYLHPRGASCPGRFILPPTHTGAIIISDVFNLFAIYYDIYMFFLKL